MKKIIPKKGILIAFGELFLKSEGVKRLFQKKLLQNLHFFLEKEKIDFRIFSFRERIFVQTEQLKKASKIIKRVFGIVWIAECFYFPETELEDFSSFIEENYKKWIKKGETFAIRMKKDRKAIEVIAKNIKRKVDLNNPKKELFIEKRRGGWFLYFKKKKGEGGLPVGASGRVLTLISGGIDSPVAAFFSAKRGAENIWLHFHSFPLVSNSSIEKVKELAKIFLKYQRHLKIYFVPFYKLQIEIKTKTPPKYRVLLYRRLMFKIAEKIARKEGCLALITGENLGQVSSQTLENIVIVREKIKIPILSPLICFDKEEIIKIAKKIKTFEISIKPQEDCCTLFVPRKQTAKGNVTLINSLEKRIDKKIEKEVLKEIKIEEY